jgi:hypothetical protein
MTTAHEPDTFQAIEFVAHCEDEDRAFASPMEALQTLNRGLCLIETMFIIKDSGLRQACFRLSIDFFLSFLPMWKSRIQIDTSLHIRCLSLFYLTILAGEVINRFLNTNSTQLTYYGISELHKTIKVCHGTVSVAL